MSCRRLFRSGIDLGPGSTVILKGNTSQCPYCGSLSAVRDGTFSVALDGVVRLIQGSNDPVATARDLQSAVRKAESTGDSAPLLTQYPALKTWLPDSPEKIAAYLTIIAILLQAIAQIFSSSAQPTLNVNQVMNVYNEITAVNTDPSPTISAPVVPEPPPKSIPKVPRNSACPCGSGRKYKRCHGR
jgi:hypothetical protein